MVGSQGRQGIPTQLSLGQFEQFVLPHLSAGRRGPAPKLSFHKIFDYLLRVLYLGCQWKRHEIHRAGLSRVRQSIHSPDVQPPLGRKRLRGAVYRLSALRCVALFGLRSKV